MGLDEQSVYADSQGSPHKVWYHLTVSACDTGLGRRLLHRMRSIEDDRASEASHFDKGGHIDDDTSVAEGATAFGKPYTAVLGGVRRHLFDLRDRSSHVPRRHELPFLDINNTTCSSGCLEQVSLTTKESRDLQHIGYFGYRRTLMTLVHIGQDRQPELVLDLLQNTQSFVHTDASRRSGGAVRFIKRGLEIERDTEVIAEASERLGGR